MAFKKQKNTSIHTTALNQQSLQFLGLTKQPFDTEILSDKNFFNSPEVEKITENLIHQVQFSDLLLTVEGLQGSGKTSLFRQLIQTEIQNIKLLSVQAEATDTLVQIQQKMSLHLQDLGDANHLDDNLKSLQMFDQTPLLIMDNSHVLSDITLQEFFRYQQQLKNAHEVNLKILLFANIGMSETIKNISDIQDNKMYVQNMPIFSAQQASDFISHRLKNAGYTGEPLLNKTDIETLLKKLKATPANIMLNAAPAIDKIVKRQSTPHKGKLSKVFLLLLLLITISLAAAAYFYLSFTEKTTEDNPDVDIKETDIFIAKENEAGKTQTTAIGTLKNSELNNPPPAVSIQPEPEVAVDIGIATPQLTAQPSDLPAFEKNRIVLPSVKTPAQLTTAVDTKSDEIIEKVISDNKEDTKPVEKNLSETQAPKPAHTTKPIQSTPAPQVKTPPVATQPAPEPHLIEPAVTLHPALRQLNQLGVNDGTWINQQASSAWTLQLLGARDPSTLLKFARQHRLGAGIAWYKTTLKGRPYYVLIHGSYPGRDIARASISKLSSQLRALKPWVKSMKSVQRAIQ